MENAAPMACLVEAQREAQDFLREHPKYRLARFRCEVNVPRHVEI